MRRFRNIVVVPLTGDRTVPVETTAAVDLAVTNDAELTVFGVIPQPSRAQRLLRIGDRDETMASLLTAGVTAHLSSWTASVADRLNVKVEVGDGQIPIEIVRQVLRRDHDLVIMTTDGSDESATIVKRVLRKCPCPVWVIRSPAPTGPVVAAVDPDDDPAFNALILQVAASQAARRQVKLHIVHAWQFSGEAALVGTEYMLLGADAIGKHRDEVGFAHREALDALLDFVELDPPAPTVHLIEQRPVQAITDLVERLDADLLVMGAVGRGAIEGALMGNTAERVLDAIERSVVVIKPPDFVCPVSLPA